MGRTGLVKKGRFGALFHGVTAKAIKSSPSVSSGREMILKALRGRLDAVSNGSGDLALGWGQKIIFTAGS